MNPQIAQLIEKIRALEEELEVALAARAEELSIQISRGRIAYTKEILEAHRALKANLLRYVLDAPPAKILSAPLIYGLVVPLFLLDLSVTIYQTVCFPVYGITKVSRRDYLVYDRGALAYLNIIEKFNCFYCSYANGLLSYCREIAGRTELYWCPIKHAKRIKAAHPHYSRFFDYGDAEGFREGLKEARDKTPKADGSGGT